MGTLAVAKLLALFRVVLPCFAVFAFASDHLHL